MSDRAAFLDAIEADPADDTRRVVYADWLDEREDATDLDRATAEFIRISCQSSERGKCRQSKAEGKWLAANWDRLLPSAVVASRYKPRRTGRWLSLAAYVRDGIPLNRRQEVPLCVFVRLEFWRGFLRRVLFDSAFELELLLPTLVLDQPLVDADTTYPHATWAVAGTPEHRACLSRDTMGRAFRFVSGQDTCDHLGTGEPTIAWFLGEKAGERAAKARRDAFRALAKSYALAPAA